MLCAVVLVFWMGPAWRVAANADESLLAAAGRVIAPVFQPLGFGDWRAATALVTGLLAKETVLSTLGVLLGGELTAALPQVFSPEAAASFLVFMALYAPCVAAQASKGDLRETELRLLKEIQQAKAETIKWVAGIITAQTVAIIAAIIALMK